jgi:glyoxylase I family protein
VTIFGEPSLNSGAEAGEYWCYFLTPWGATFELASYPAGRGYEQHTSKRTWDVRNPAACFRVRPLGLIIGPVRES